MLQDSIALRIPRSIAALTLCLLTLDSTAGNVQHQSASTLSGAGPSEPSPVAIAERVASQVTRRRDLPADYTTDMELEALLELGDAVNDARYLTFVQDVMARRNTPPGHRHRWISQLYTSLPFELLIRTGNREYVAPFVEESLVYRDEVVRSFDGTVSVYLSMYDHNPAPLVSTSSGATYVKRAWTPVLLDQLQEYASRMAKAGCLSGDARLFEESATQIELMRAALRDPATGLWSPARGFVKSASTLTDTKWGRGHGWALRGMVDALTYLPPGSAEANRVEKILRELSETLLRYQDPDGFWHQVLDRADSYAETSVTGLISHSFARAIRQGLLPVEPYRRAARTAFEAIAAHRVSAAGDVYGGSKTTPPLPSTADYMEWETPVNDGHAVAATIFAAAGQIELEKASGDASASRRAALCVQPLR
jgi:unsaturated rhamnogalacturonyl hydrolase